MSPFAVQSVPAAEVERALEAVLARPELARPLEREPTLLERALERLEDLLDGFGLPAGLTEGLANVLLWLLAVLAVLAALVLGLRLARAARSGTRSRGAPSESDARRERVRELLRRAALARAAGERRGALRFELLALVIGLGERGDLEYREAWTYRELLERGRPAPEVALELAPLQAELDRKLYGGGEVSEDDLARVDALARRWLAGLAGGGA